MQADYSPFIDRMIQKYEGGYGWNKKDPGGPTKYGITCFDLAEHRGVPMDSMDRWAPIVKAMTLDEAEEIYKHKYAVALHFDALPSGIDTVMLDYGVNSGIARSMRVAAAMMKAPYTGSLDANLMGEISRCQPDWFINTMNAERLRYMHSIKDGALWQEFGHGWQARVDDLTAYSLALAHKQPTPAPNVPPPTSNAPKVQHPAPDVGNHAGGTAGGVIVAATTAHDLTWPVLIGVCAAVLIGGVVVYELKRRHAQAENEKVHL